MNTVIVPVDFSLVSYNAVDYAAAMLKDVQRLKPSFIPRV